VKKKILLSKKNLKLFNYIQNVSNVAFTSFIFDSLFHQFLNKLMTHGNKNSVILGMINSMMLIKNLTRISPLYIFRNAIFNVKPLINIKTLTRGKRLVFDSQFCSVKLQLQKAISFLIEGSNQLKAGNKSLNFSQRLALSILNCFFRQGDAYSSVLKIHSSLRNKKLNFLKNNNSSYSVFIKRTKKIKGYYHQNRYSLFRRLQYSKSN
jgi:ribosomal protein S7